MAVIALLGSGAVARAGRADAAADSVSILECARIAREISPGVRISAMDLRAARFDSAATARNRRPGLSVFGGAKVAPEGAYDPAVTDLGHYELKAGIEWPLFDGGARRRARARAANDAALAAFELERTRRESGLRAGGLAIEVLRLGDRERYARLSLDWLAGLASVLESGVRAGAHGRSDALRVALERDAVQADLEASGTELGIALRELGQLLGRADAPPRVREPDRGEDRAPDEGDFIRLVTGVERLAELGAARAGQEGQRLDLADTRRRNAVRVDAAADAGLAGTDLTRVVPPDLEAERPGATLADRLRRDRGASATVEVRMPVADPSLGPALDARAAGLEAAGLRLAAETDTQRRLGLDLLARWRAASGRLAAARVTTERADAHVLRMKSLYTAGTASLLDLLDARRTLDDARGRLADARAATRLARLEAELRP